MPDGANAADALSELPPDVVDVAESVAEPVALASLPDAELVAGIA